MNRVVKLKLNCQSSVFRETVRQYTLAYNESARLGWDENLRNRTALHKRVYRSLREQFGLPSQLAVSAIGKSLASLNTCDGLKKIGVSVNCPASRKQSIQYDARSYTINFRSNTVSLLTIDGRFKTTFEVPEYFRQYLDWKYGSAELVIRGSEVYLHVSFTKEDPGIPSNGKFVGVDRGVNRVAVTSQNQFFGDGHIWNVVDRYQELKARLQSCGSRSAQRHLSRIKEKETRFRADVDHKISKRIIESLAIGTTIVLEDLSSIRKNCKFRKPQRKRIHRWSFFRLETFLTYKGQLKGIRVMKVDPRYTSQTCSRCGHCEPANRKGSSFWCRSCGFRLHADLNAARNIESRGSTPDATCHPGRADVNQPIARRKV